MSKYCSNCGNELKEEDVFCSKCGNKNKTENTVNTSSDNTPKKKCKHCKEKIDKKATTCPYCGKGQHEFARTLLLAILIIIIGAVCYSARINTKDLTIINSTGKVDALGYAYYEGDLVNNGKSDIHNVRITFTVYNKSREKRGKLETNIEFIKAGETLHFKATGLVGYEEGLQVVCNIEKNVF